MTNGQAPDVVLIMCRWVTEVYNGREIDRLRNIGLKDILVGGALNDDIVVAARVPDDAIGELVRIMRSDISVHVRWMSNDLRDRLRKRKLTSWRVVVTYTARTTYHMDYPTREDAQRVVDELTDKKTVHYTDVNGTRVTILPKRMVWVEMKEVPI